MPLYLTLKCIQSIGISVGEKNSDYRKRFLGMPDVRLFIS